MSILHRLLRPHRPTRTFALLDETGHCCGFYRSAQAPLGAHWVEVSQQRLSWLHNPLPSDARIGDDSRAQSAATSRIG